MPIPDGPSRLDGWVEVPIPHLGPQEHLAKQNQLEELKARALRDSNRSLAALFEEALRFPHCLSK